MTEQMDQPSGTPETGRHIPVGTSVIDRSASNLGTVTHSAPGTVVVEWSEGLASSGYGITAPDPDTLRTAADLWTEFSAVVDSPYVSARLFALSSYADYTEDADVRYIPWCHILVDRTEPWRARYPDSEESMLFALLVCYGDYVGSSYDASNYRVIKSGFGDAHPAGLLFDVGLSAHDGIGLAVRIGDPNWTLPQLSTFVDMISALAEYPVIDEDDYSEYENELADAAWGAYLQSDTENALMGYAADNYFDDWRDLHRKSCYLADPRDLDDIVRNVYYSFEENEWICETATSAVNSRHEEAVAHVIDTVFRLDPLPINDSGQIALLTYSPDAWCDRCNRPFSTHA